MMWETRKLGDVLKVVRGSSPRPIKNYVTDSEDGVNWVKIGDVDERDKYVTRTKEKISRIGAEKSRFVDVGDFIFSNSMSFGRAYIMAIPGYIHDGWFTFKLPDYLNPDYLWYLFRSPLLVEQIKGLAAGAIVQNISSDLIKKCDLPIPPLEEQQKIVEILDKAFELIDQAKANIEQNIINAKELFQSKLDEVFSQKGDGWAKCNITQVTKEIFAGGDVDKNNLSTDKTIDFSIPIYTNGEKGNGLYGYTNLARVKERSITVSARGTIGFTVIRNEPYYPAVRLICLIPNDKIEIDFLYYFIKSKTVDSTGTSIPQLTVPMVKAWEVKFPISIEEQRSYCDFLEELFNMSENVIDRYQQKLSNLEELRKSILEKAFKGELTN